MTLLSSHAIIIWLTRYLQHKSKGDALVSSNGYPPIENITEDVIEMASDADFSKKWEIRYKAGEPCAPPPGYRILVNPDGTIVTPSKPR